MAFKKIPPPPAVPDSPEKVLLDLPRRKIPGVLLHQGEMMRNYADSMVAKTDVAIQLPTGSGKTLVGLLIAEWRRRKFRERIVYLCPTRQLVNQVVEQANNVYGLSVHGFTGSAKAYPAKAKADYQSAERVAITTYSSLFNTNPYFDNADIVVVDDAHAAENYISAFWSLKIERQTTNYQSLHSAVINLLEPILGTTNFARARGDWEGPDDRQWVEKIPTPFVMSITDELESLLDTHTPDTDLQFPWQLLRGHLFACHIYVSCQEILIRPLIPPTWLHEAFEKPKQRIYMSATLGAGGDLERLTGRKHIDRLAIPVGWDKQGIGRRFFIFPEMSLDQDETVIFRRTLMKKAGRSLVLVPSDRIRNEIAKDVDEQLRFKTFNANDIEESKQAFINSAQAVAIVANRYDGIDFPGSDCRLLFIEGLPKATNLQERFLMSRMGAAALLNERIQSRVLQAIGRCTRSLQDFSAVVVTGEDLPDYLADRHRWPYLHPELQAELEFGVEQSKNSRQSEMIENFDIFIENGTAWEVANQQIISLREQASRLPLPAIDELEDVVSDEVAYQMRMWQEDYLDALDNAESILAKITNPDLRGYRALWHYLAASAATLSTKAGPTDLDGKAREHFRQAKEAAKTIPWLVSLSRYSPPPDPAVETRNKVSAEQVERLEQVLLRLGRVHDRSYARFEKEILEGLTSAEKFEQGQLKLGELLGFSVGKIESDGSPDPWWIAGDICFVFEDHAGASPTSTFSATKARQAATHPNWMRENVTASKDKKILAVLVTPVKKAEAGAIPHLREVALWELNEYITWARNAVAIVRTLRRSFYEPGDLVWRAQTVAQLESNKLDATSLLEYFQSHPTADALSANA